jgi:hypothetical protein
MELAASRLGNQGVYAVSAAAGPWARPLGDPGEAGGDAKR